MFYVLVECVAWMDGKFIMINFNSVFLSLSPLLQWIVHVGCDWEMLSFSPASKSRGFLSKTWMLWTILFNYPTFSSWILILYDFRLKNWHLMPCLIYDITLLGYLFCLINWLKGWEFYCCLDCDSNLLSTVSQDVGSKVTYYVFWQRSAYCRKYSLLDSGFAKGRFENL